MFRPLNPPRQRCAKALWGFWRRLDQQKTAPNSMGRFLVHDLWCLDIVLAHFICDESSLAAGQGNDGERWIFRRTRGELAAV
jgi:hypothetical protein